MPGRRYLTGIIISLFIASIVFVPRPRQDTQLTASWLHIALAFAHAVSCWFFMQWQFRKKGDRPVWVLFGYASLVSAGLAMTSFFFGGPTPAPAVLDHPGFGGDDLPVLSVLSVPHQ